MEIIAFSSLAALAFIAHLAIHEAGHVIVMKRYGVSIQEVGIGAPIWPRLVLKATVRRPYRVSLSPWLIMAYIRVDQGHGNKIGALSYQQTAWCYGVGITSNLTSGLALLGIHEFLYGSLSIGGILTVSALATWVLRRPFAAYVIPGMALVALAFTAYTLFQAPEPAEASGYIALAQLLVSSSAKEAIGLAGAIGVALAVMNLLPIYPSDTGQIWSNLIDRWIGSRSKVAFQLGGMAAMVLIIGYSCFSDITRVLR